MKRCFLVGLLLAGIVRGAAAEKTDFTSSVAPEDLAAAGLGGLTSAQRARLNALVEDYQSGTIASARRAAADAVAAKQAAEVQAARAEKKMEEARLEAAKVEAKRVAVAKAEAANAEAARVETAKSEAARAEAAKAEAARKSVGGSSMLAKARDMLKPAPKAEAESIQSTVPGRFSGWESRQILTLANGQRWQVANGERYYTPAVENPPVVIVPATFAGFWMRFPTLGAEVRVTLVSE